jgi:hypothetical protein
MCRIQANFHIAKGQVNTKKCCALDSIVGGPQSAPGCSVVPIHIDTVIFLPPPSCSLGKHDFKAEISRPFFCLIFFDDYVFPCLMMNRLGLGHQPSSKLELLTLLRESPGRSHSSTPSRALGYPFRRPHRVCSI